MPVFSNPDAEHVRNWWVSGGLWSIMGILGTDVTGQSGPETRSGPNYIPPADPGDWWHPPFDLPDDEPENPCGSSADGDAICCAICGALGHQGKGEFNGYAAGCIPSCDCDQDCAFGDPVDKV